MCMQQIHFKKIFKNQAPYSDVYIAVLCAVFQESRCGIYAYFHTPGMEFSVSSVNSCQKFFKQ